MSRFALFAAGLTIGLSVARGAEPVTVTRAGPIEKLDADGRPDSVSMAQVGTVFTLVKVDGTNLLLKDAAGTEYLLASQATNYSPPPLAPASGQPATNGAAPAPAKAVVQTAPAASSLSGEDADKIKQLNDALGISLLADSSFWNDDVDAVAQRLGWPRESKTATEESYRRYAKPGQAKVLGASAYSLALYGRMGKPTYISIIFANAGDFPEAAKIDDPFDLTAIAAVKKDLTVAVKKDADAIAGALTPLLGEPSVTLFGNSSSNRDEVHRWDWNDLAILLNAHEGEYVSIKIVSAAVADRHGTMEVTERDEMRDLLAKRVVRRENGDVIVSEMPMVDQGPKGYCVPATWERYLRYMDVPADLYVLAIMGDSGLGGGTDFERMKAGVDDYVSAYHRRIENYDGPLDVAHIAKYIDQGLPLMWTCWIKEQVERQTSKNTEERKKVTDWNAYAKALVTQDAALGPNFADQDMTRTNGHMRLIIGYNTATNEIAISDSWGEAMAERWMYVGTADRISQGQIGYLSW